MIEDNISELEDSSKELSQNAAKTDRDSKHEKIVKKDGGQIKT